MEPAHHRWLEAGPLGGPCWLQCREDGGEEGRESGWQRPKPSVKFAVVGRSFWELGLEDTDLICVFLTNSPEEGNWSCVLEHTDLSLNLAHVICVLPDLPEPQFPQV